MVTLLDSKPLFLVAVMFISGFIQSEVGAQQLINDAQACKIVKMSSVDSFDKFACSRG